MDAYALSPVPSVIIPTGLTQQQTEYLYEKVREYVYDKSKVNNVCPRPTHLPTTNQTTLSNSDLPGPSSALASTPNAHCDEVGSDQIPLRKRRTKAELNLLYPCTMCDSNQTLYQHKKDAHNGPPTAACSLANSKASDNEDDKQKVRKRRKKSEIDLCAQ